MFLIKLYLLLLWAVAIYSQAQIQQNKCACQNGGVCSKNEEVQFCKCPDNFVDKNCTKQAVQLTQLQYTANITQAYSYYFVNFNTSSLFYIQILFCPVSFDPNSTYFAHIDFEEQDGSINNNPASESYSFRLKQEQCVVAKYVIFPFKKRYNGELIRLILQLKSNKRSHNSTQGNVPNQIDISYTIYQFNQINDEDMGKFLLISMASSSILFCITLVICRRIVERRIRRFVYQPARITRNISSFDQTMPPIFFQRNLNLNDEDKQCMICLLGVENTYTRLTPCNHLFHKDCIDEWGRKSLTCPTCRHSLEEQRIFEP